MESRLASNGSLHLAVAATLGCVTLHAGAQSAPPAPPAPPVDAGTLLQQQRRADPLQRAVPPVPSEVLRTQTTGEAGALSDGPGVVVQRFEFTGATRLDAASLTAAVAPWIGRTSSLADLRRAAAAVAQAARSAGWLAEVTLPPQDITDGTVRLQVSEARMGRVQVQVQPQTQSQIQAGAAARVQALLAAALPTGEPLSLAKLERALLLADDLPGLSASASLQAGVVPGTTDLVLQLRATPLLRGDVSLDNAASRFTGSTRAALTLTLDNPLDFGEQLGAALTATRGSQSLRLTGVLPLGDDGWRLASSASALRYRVLAALNNTTGLPPEGNTQTLTLDAQYPLVLTSQQRLTLSLGTERRRQRNLDDTDTAGVLATTSASRTDLLNLALAGWRFDTLGGGGQVQATLQLSSGRLTLDGSAPAILTGDAATAATQGRFTRLRWSLLRLQRLDADTSVLLSASGQHASRNLDATDRFYLGGQGAVNAYPVGEAGGSSGQLLSLELRRQFGAQLSVSAFADQGWAQPYATNQRADGNGEIVANNNLTLKGVGLGAAWRADTGLQLRATLARRIGSNPSATANGTDSDGSRRLTTVWLAATLPF